MTEFFTCFFTKFSQKVTEISPTSSELCSFDNNKWGKEAPFWTKSCKKKSLLPVDHSIFKMDRNLISNSFRFQVFSSSWNHHHQVFRIKSCVFGLWGMGPLLCLQRQPSCLLFYYSAFLQLDSCFAWQMNQRRWWLLTSRLTHKRTQVLECGMANKPGTTSFLWKLSIKGIPATHIKNCSILCF